MEIAIRHFCPETDSSTVANIWVNGLNQTVQAKWWPVRPIWQFMFDKMAEDALSPDGDVGPDGKNLSEMWCNSAGNKCMLVAETNISDEGSVVVGCCGVVRGTSLGKNTKNISNDETTFSIWKMSVVEEFRGKGVGAKLILGAEDWAKRNGCLRMRMITANPIASRFYQSHGYDMLGLKLFGVWLGKWHEKQL